MTILLFGGDDYYARGGACDFRGVYESADAARAAFDATPNDWGQVAVLDGGNLRIVWEYGTWGRSANRGPATEWRPGPDA